MKFGAFVTAIWLGIFSFAQDTLVFKKDDAVIPVRILEMQFGNELIIYLHAGDTAITQFLSIDKVYYQGVWQKPQDFNTAAQVDFDEEKRELIFRNRIGYEPKPFLVSVNPFSPILDLNSWRFRNELFNDNKSIGFDLEYRFHEKFSLKIPVIIGLEIPSNPKEVTIVDVGYSYINFPYVYANYWIFAGENPETGQISIYNRIRERSNNELHARTLLYQGGVGFKFFPFGYSKDELYISQSFNVGLGDMASVNYYYDFDTIGYIYGGLQYDLVSEKAIASSNKFVYFRYEALVGLSFNLGKYIGFTYETGYSTLMRNRGEVEDRVYIKTFGDEYQLQYTELFQSPYNSTNLYSSDPLGVQRYRAGNIINRFTIVFRFGQKIAK